MGRCSNGRQIIYLYMEISTLTWSNQTRQVQLTGVCLFLRIGIRVQVLDLE